LVCELIVEFEVANLGIALNQLAGNSLLTDVFLFSLCRICEICGATAVNITGIGDDRFLERRFISSGGHSSERNGGCLRGQTFCNFLMACLVIAFVLPWFLRVDML